VCRELGAKAVGKDCFLFFKKTFFAKRHVQLCSAKLGTPELGKFFPELPSVVAKTLDKCPFADGPSRQRGHILFFFFPH
jgi:hypothetical protein